MLKARTKPIAVELLFLDGEEATGEWQGTDHTYGSRYYVEAARKDGTLKDIRAFILVDMIGDRELRDQARVELDAVADRIDLGRGAKRLNRRGVRRRVDADRGRSPEFLEAGVPAVDLIDLEDYTRSVGGMAHPRGHARQRERRDRSKPSGRRRCWRRCRRSRRQLAKLGRALTRRCSSALEDLCFGQHRRGRLGPREDRVDLRVA